MARAYLFIKDPKLAPRTWSAVMEEMDRNGPPQTQERCRRGIRTNSKTLGYQRLKLGPESKPALISIGERLLQILRQLPSSGPLFPHISTPEEGGAT